MSLLWTVKKNAHGQWCADNGVRSELFPTLAEAHTYATEQSRTVPVVLPKDVEDHYVVSSKKHRIDDLWGGAILRSTSNDYDDDGDSVFVGDEHLKEVGEYFLALHYLKER